MPGQLSAARGELSAMKFSPRTPLRPILILRTARSIDTWAERVVRIWATAGDLDKRDFERTSRGVSGIEHHFQSDTSSSSLSVGVQVFQTVSASEPPLFYSCVARRRRNKDLGLIYRYQFLIYETVSVFLLEFNNCKQSILTTE